MKYYAVSEELKIKAGEKVAIDKVKKPTLYIFENEEDAKSIAQVIARKNEGYQCPVFNIAFRTNKGRKNVLDTDPLVGPIELNGNVYTINPAQVNDFTVQKEFSLMAAEGEISAHESSSASQSDSEEVENSHNGADKKEEAKKAKSAPVPAKEGHIETDQRPFHPALKGVAFFGLGGIAGLALWKSQYASGLLSLALEQTGLPGLSTLGLAAKGALYFGAGVACVATALAVGMALNMAYNKGRNFWYRWTLNSEIAKLPEEESKKLAEELREKINQLDDDLVMPDGSPTTYPAAIAWGIDQLRQAQAKTNVEERLELERQAIAQVGTYQSRKKIA